MLKRSKRRQRTPHRHASIAPERAAKPAILASDNGRLSEVELPAAEPPDVAFPTGLAHGDVERIADYVADSLAPATRRAHASDWARFEGWCADRNLEPLPAAAGTVAGYLAGLAERLQASTIGRHAASISVAHKAAGHPSPMMHAGVRSVLQGIRRRHGKPPTKKAPLAVGDLRALVGSLGDGLADVRDRAVLLLGFVGAFRRSELAGIDVDDLDFRAEGLVVLLRRSKTDQEGHGREVEIGYAEGRECCPVLAVRSWLDRAGLETGPVFRAVDRHGKLRTHGLSGRAIAEVVKRRVAALGLDPARFGGHSLRSGFATAASQAGVDEGEIAEVTGHRSVAVLRGYVQRGRAFSADLTRRLGL